MVGFLGLSCVGPRAALSDFCGSFTTKDFLILFLFSNISDGNVSSAVDQSCTDAPTNTVVTDVTCMIGLHKEIFRSSNQYSMKIKLLLIKTGRNAAS
ncbi:hypothetical protein Nmel_014690 [Mimus melanotis]